MTLKTLILSFLTLVFLSCKPDKKDIKPDMKFTLTEKKEIGYKLLSFESKSIDENVIITDIKYILNKLNKEKLIDKNQLLIWLYAVCSG